MAHVLRQIAYLLAIPNLVPQSYDEGGRYDKLIAAFKNHLRIVPMIVQH